MKTGHTKVPTKEPDYTEKYLATNPETTIPDLYRAYLGGFLENATGERLIEILAVALGVSDRDNKLPPCSVKKLLERLKDNIRFPWEEGW